MATNLINSVKVSNLSWKGQQPPVTNPSPLGEGGKKALVGSQLDFNNGATPPSYNPPRS